jgi:8-oxo-dGTP diphosphatase
MDLRLAGKAAIVNGASQGIGYAIAHLLAEEGARLAELREETGIRVATVGPQVGQREFVLLLSDGEHVLADERFFRVEVKEATLSRGKWTAEEAEVIVAHRWWSREELSQTSETVWPENLIVMLPEAGTL